MHLNAIVFMPTDSSSLSGMTEKNKSFKTNIQNHLEANSARHYPSCHSSAHRLGRNQLHHSLLKSPLAHRMTLFNF